MKVIFISSLERSGSTILDLSLSQYPEVISLGEIWRTIQPHGTKLDSVMNRPCSCGVAAQSCTLWRPVFDALSKMNSNSSLTDCYETMLRVVQVKTGGNVILVDSSKSIQAFNALKNIQEFEVQVIHTIRDVRGWMNSIWNANQIKTELPWGKIFEPDFSMFWLSYFRHNILRKIPLWLPHEWLLRNLRLQRNIAKSGLKQLNISYESLVFDNKKTMSSIEQFLGVQEVLNSKNSSYKPQIHIIRGNRTAFHSTYVDDLKYDSSWMLKLKYCIMMALVPWVMVFNRCQVYSYIKNN